jgi:hypothetical protein
MSKERSVRPRTKADGSDLASRSLANRRAQAVPLEAEILGLRAGQAPSHRERVHPCAPGCDSQWPRYRGHVHATS